MGQNSVNDDCYVPPVNLGCLTDEQKSIAIQMLKEESESFAKDHDDLGCAEDLQLKINLSDTTPVQKICSSIPCTLYPEVKGYIEDLLNKKCITSPDHLIQAHVLLFVNDMVAYACALIIMN